MSFYGGGSGHGVGMCQYSANTYAKEGKTFEEILRVFYSNIEFRNTSNEYSPMKDYQNYLYFTLKQPQYFTLMQNLNRNAAQPGLTGRDLDIIKIFKPKKEIINKFNSIIDPILHKIFKLAKVNRLLEKQRDALLPRLMSGKLEIK